MDEEKDPIKGLVEEALGNVTTPLLMKYHLDQLHENGMLYDLMRYETGAKNIPFELSLIYLTKPQHLHLWISRKIKAGVRQTMH